MLTSWVRENPPAYRRPISSPRRTFTTPPLPAHSLRLVRGRYHTLGSVAGIVPFLFLSASCLGSSVVRYAIHGRASSLLSTPGLRSVAPVRSPLLVPRHSAFPTLGRYDPATRDVATFHDWNIEPCFQPLNHWKDHW